MIKKIKIVWFDFLNIYFFKEIDKYRDSIKNELKLEGVQAESLIIANKLKLEILASQTNILRQQAEMIVAIEHIKENIEGEKSVDIRVNNIELLTKQSTNSLLEANNLYHDIQNHLLTFDENKYRDEIKSLKLCQYNHIVKIRRSSVITKFFHSLFILIATILLVIICTYNVYYIPHKIAQVESKQTVQLKRYNNIYYKIIHDTDNIYQFA